MGALKDIVGSEDRGFEEFCESFKKAAGGDEGKAMSLMEEYIVEEHILFKIRQRKPADHQYLNNHRKGTKQKSFLDPVVVLQQLGVYVPKKKRGSRSMRATRAARVISFEDDDQVRGEKDVLREEEEKPKKKPTKDTRKRPTSSSHDDDDAKQEPKKKKKGAGTTGKFDLGKLGLDELLDCSDEIRESILEKDDTDLKLVMVKKLYHTDLDLHQDRLAMPARQILDLDNFLREEEKEKVFGSREGLMVKLVDPSLVVSDMRLTKWPFHNQKDWFSFELTKGWRAVVERNPHVLKPNALLQVYSFRRNAQLCLVLWKLPLPPRPDNACGSTSNGDASQKD
ncbi:hypothetical protein Tsubulata_033708 [Turnera subulata]|uniref:TF-B3 domain-containing protein n=1 Tax=Turnera subulata TaxID=218843 RepID=A0A9Q0J7L4_9ROSI|nr:hypothetical protein Tsubulata_033708 [Turnera subulata]